MRNAYEESGYCPEDGIAGKYVLSKKNKSGQLTDIKFVNDDNFNFAFDVVDVLAEKCPNKTAMIHVDKNGKERKISFKNMMQYSNKAANYFQFLGIKKGDRVLLVLKRHYQFWFSILALHKIGAIAIPASFLLTKKDFEYRFNAANIDAVIASSDAGITKEIDKAAKAYEGLKAKVVVGVKKEGWHSFNNDIKYFSATFDRNAKSPGGNEPMLMFFTSGTTAYPKMVVHSYKYPLGHYITAKYWHCVDPEGVHFTISDTGWGKALWGKLYGQWLCEAAVFTYDYNEFFAKEILQMIEKYKITTFCAPPTVYRVLVHLDMSQFDLSSLQTVTTAGEALNPEIYAKFKKATGLDIMEGFGQTETTLTIANLKGTKPKPGSMGKPSPAYDVRVMRSDGTIADKGETGEIVVGIENGIPRGLFLGYEAEKGKVKNPVREGFYHTGDTGYMDKDGYLWYVGRVDDIIKSAGYRVGPFEIENEVMKLPYVLECAVTSVPDKIRGQAIKATIVLADGYVGDDELKKETLKYFRANMASYKRPKIVEFVDELPKTTSGKIRRAEIKEKDWK